MKWSLKKTNKSKKDFEKSPRRLEEARQILETVNSSLAKEVFDLTEKISVLEKESVYWKEKALNFRRFHQ